MENETNFEMLKGFAQTGLKLRYGENPPKEAVLRLLYELRRIDLTGYADFYLMAFWIYRYTSGIKVWPRGAMSSSIVCYSLMLTDIDPIRYGLHSARFVNDQPPKFQFDIEETRFEEFNRRAEERLKANSDRVDYESTGKILFADLQPSAYLTRPMERPEPDNVDDEMASYALSFPDTMELYHTYNERKNGSAWQSIGIGPLDDILAPTYGLIVYQEQMFDILKSMFGVHGIKANDIRLSIQRNDTLQMELYRNELKETAVAKGLCEETFDTAWSVLTSNPRAFLKAHAASRVRSTYYYELKLL